MQCQVKGKNKNIFCSSDSSCALESLLWLLTPLTDAAQVVCCSLCQALSCVHITVATLTIALCETEEKMHIIVQQKILNISSND